MLANHAGRGGAQCPESHCALELRPAVGVSLQGPSWVLRGHRAPLPHPLDSPALAWVGVLFLEDHGL